MVTAGILGHYADSYPEKLKTKLVLKRKTDRSLPGRKAIIMDSIHDLQLRDTIGKFRKLTGNLIKEEIQHNRYGQ